jgi:hypothetical protein
MLIVVLRTRAPVNMTIWLALAFIVQVAAHALTRSRLNNTVFNSSSNRLPSNPPFLTGTLPLFELRMSDGCGFLLLDLLAWRYSRTF